jgi:tetratricopeptide (TPR) repeat protein
MAAGNAAATAGESVAALAAFERAAAARPRSRASLQNVGIIALQLGHAERAADAFAAALQLDPGDAALLNGLGQARLQRGDLAGAVGAMHASVAAEPDAARRARWAANLATAARQAGGGGLRSAERAAAPAHAEQADAWAARLDTLRAAAAAAAHAPASCPSDSAAAATIGALVAPAPDPLFGGGCARVAASSLSADGFMADYVLPSVPVIITGALRASLPDADALAAAAAALGDEEDVPLPVSLAFPGGATHRVLPGAHPAVAAALGGSAAAWRVRLEGSPAGRTAVLRAPQSRMRLRTLLALLRTPGAPQLYAQQLPADLFVPSLLNGTGVTWATPGDADDGAAAALLPPPPFAARMVPMAAPHAWLTGAAATGLHFDRGDNLLALLSGAKRVLLLRPAEAPRLRYTAALDVVAGSAGAGATVTDNHALEDAFAPPAAGAAAAWAGGATGLTCDLAAGEVLYMPFHWHHAVATTPAPAPDCTSVALNWWFTPQLTTEQAMVAHGLPPPPPRRRAGEL